MKKSSQSIPLPNVTEEEVAKAMTVEAPVVIFLRVAPEKREEVKKAAAFFELSVTDYLMRCHDLVLSKSKR